MLVWIHGGAFLEGSGSDSLYGPDFLINRDNIVVTFNYRVGIFGFLNLGFDEYTGNMGLKDQQMALKWIHKNIENFSGNKDEVLLFGQSAGMLKSFHVVKLKFFADFNLNLYRFVSKREIYMNLSGGASVNFQMLNEKSRKYFNRAFIMSGTALTFFALSEINHMDRMHGCAGVQNTEKLIDYLKTTDAETIAKCHFTTGFDNLFTSPWAPTIENATTNGAFITRMPEEIYSYDRSLAMDTLFSFTSQVFLMAQNSILKYVDYSVSKGIHHFHSGADE